MTTPQAEPAERDVWWHLRISPDEHAAVRQRAAEKGYGIAEYGRELLRVGIAKEHEIPPKDTRGAIRPNRGGRPRRDETKKTAAVA